MHDSEGVVDTTYTVAEMELIRRWHAQLIGFDGNQEVRREIHRYLVARRRVAAEVQHEIHDEFLSRTDF